MRRLSEAQAELSRSWMGGSAARAAQRDSAEGRIAVSRCCALPSARAIRRAWNFLWTVRFHLHYVAGRAEERLTFDYQREIAARMNYADRPGKSAVERFMQYYFIQADVHLYFS